MEDEDLIRALLSRAGMIMEDILPRIIGRSDTTAGDIALLRDAINDVVAFADAAAAIRRQGAEPQTQS